MATKTAVKERPILMSAPMVKAIREGRKTQTRRVVNCGCNCDHLGRLLGDWGCSVPPYRYEGGSLWRWEGGRKPVVGEWIEEVQDAVDDATTSLVANPYGEPGDRLWVRESLREDLGCACYAADMAPVFTDGDATEWRWNRRSLPSIHMPRWASRLLLEITDVRVERLNDISEKDAWDEGFDNPRGTNRDYPDRARYWFKTLWESINGPGSWAVNPWVWAIAFRVLEGRS